MKAEKMKLSRATRITSRYALLVLFAFVSFFMALAYPSYAFIVSAFIFLCYLNYSINLPANRCTEGPLYGDDPQGFFDYKVRLTAILWVTGIIVMTVIFAVLMYFEGVLPSDDPEILPDVSITGSVIMLMLSLAPFIPATFALMKASYEYDGRIMGTLMWAIITIMFALIFAILLRGVPSDFVFSFYNFETIPFLPLSIIVLAASLIISYYLIKSAKRSFTEYVESSDDSNNVINDLNSVYKIKR